MKIRKKKGSCMLCFSGDAMVVVTYFLVLKLVVLGGDGWWSMEGTTGNLLNIT